MTRLESCTVMRSNAKSRATATALVAAVLATLFLAVPVEAKKKKIKKVFELEAHPTEIQKNSFVKDAVDHCTYLEHKGQESYADCEERELKDSEAMIRETRGPIFITAEISLHEGSRWLRVMISVQNRGDKKDGPPVEILPQKVFLVDGRGQVHPAVTEYEARAAIAAEHRLPPFAPPPSETYYTITQVPLDSRAPVPPDPSQPQFTIFVPEVTPHVDYSRQLGYEIGYLIGAWLNKRDARKQLKWIDENWFHRKRLAPWEFQVGWLMFEDVLETRFSPDQLCPITPSPEELEWDDFVQAVVEKKRDYMRYYIRSFESLEDSERSHGSTDAQQDRCMKLVIFIEDQQFVFRFGPEIVGREHR